MTGGDRAGEAPVPLTTWLAVGGALLGAFLTVLNTQITNTALPYIEGGIGTGGVYGTDGNVYDWFGSPYIVKLSLVAAVALGAFVVLEFLTVEPVVNLRLLGRRNFGFGTLGNFLLGFALYAAAYLLPQYLAVWSGSRPTRRAPPRACST